MYAGAHGIAGLYPHNNATSLSMFYYLWKIYTCLRWNESDTQSKIYSVKNKIYIVRKYPERDRESRI